MAKSDDERLAKITARRNKTKRQLRELNRQAKMIEMHQKLAEYEEIAPIALAAIDVFGNKMPKDRESARQLFMQMRDKMYSTQDSSNNANN